MIKFELPELGMETIIESYSISKKRKEIAVLTEISTKARFENPDYDTLFRETVEGNTTEPALVTIFCGQEFEEFEATIRHNEGTFLHKACIAEKDVKIINPFECIKDNEINIFDYPADTIQTQLGAIERMTFSNSVISYNSDETYIFPLNEILALTGVGDLGSKGYFPEYIHASAEVQKNVYNDPTYGDYETYGGHSVSIYISYVRVISPTKLSENWLTLPATEGTGFYYVGLPIKYGPPNISLTGIRDIIGFTPTYINVFYEAGKLNAFNDVGLSNMIDFNKMMEGIFECVEYPLISNFFGINPDGSEPQNEEYLFALANYQSLRIAQASDIITANADDDAFGKSGLLKVKKALAEITMLFELLLVFDESEDVVRLEHISYFNQKGLNLVARDIPYELNDEITVNRENVNREFFRWAVQTETELFYQSTVDYQNYTIADKLNEKTEASELFVTDYISLLNNQKYDKDEYNKLFVLLATKDGGIIENNQSLAMVKLTNALKLTNRYSLRALKDGLPIVFKGYSIGFECEVKFAGSIGLFKKLFPMNTVKLSNGVWLIEEIEYKDSKNMTLKIRK
jgi:hypothetical protein